MCPCPGELGSGRVTASATHDRNCSNFNKMEFAIQHEWNSAPTTHDPVTICLKPAPEGLQMNVSAKFFNDPPAPLGPAGEPFQALWDYEDSLLPLWEKMFVSNPINSHNMALGGGVRNMSAYCLCHCIQSSIFYVVEAFFLNSEKEQYLEVELGPHGHHLVLLLSQRRHIWKDCLPLSFQSSITEETWKGRALLPWEYFPPSVDRFNAFAIHGSGLKRTYEALYPIPAKEVQEGQQPDFHQLEYFRPFNYNVLMGEEWKKPASNLWKM